MERSGLCVSTTSNFDEIFAQNFWNPWMELLFHVQIGGIFELLVDEIDLAESRFLVTLLLTRKVLMIPHDALSGTIARGESLLWYGTVASPVTSTC